MDESLKRALSVWMTEMKKPDEDRDAQKLAEAERAIQAAVEADGDQAKAAQVLKALTDRVGQLEREMSEETEKRRALERSRVMAYSGRTGEPVVRPDGRPRLRFAHPEMAREMFEFGKSVLKACTGGGIDKVLVPGGGQGEGYVIPETLDAQIEMMVESVGIARRLAGPVPLPAGTLNVARRLAGAVAYWKAAGAEAKESAPQFGQYSMAAQTLIALIETALEFEEDAAINIGNYLAEEFAYAIMDVEDDAAINGDGTADYGMITGILASDRVTVVTMDGGDAAFTALDSMDYLTDLETNVWDRALENATYLMHRSILAQVKKIKDSVGLPIWQPAVQGEPSEIMGYPFARTGKMPAISATDVSTRFVAFGDFRRGLKLGRRGAYRLDWSAVPGFKNLTNCWRAFERIDMEVVGFTAAEIASHAELGNPIAVLRTAAA